MLNRHDEIFKKNLTVGISTLPNISQCLLSGVKVSQTVDLGAE